MSFNDFTFLLGLIRKIKDGSIDLEKANKKKKKRKKKKEKFRSNLSETTRGK